MLKRIRGFLRAGVLEGGLVSPTEEGTPQGGPLSPMVAKIFLHEVRDAWVEREVRLRMRGSSVLRQRGAETLVTEEPDA